MREVYIRCTFNEMVENDILDHGIGGRQLTDGFSIGKKGKATFYMYDPTPNGFYKIYEQNEAGDIVSIRYIDGCKTIVTVWRNYNTVQPVTNKP